MTGGLYIANSLRASIEQYDSIKQKLFSLWSQSSAIALKSRTVDSTIESDPESCALPISNKTAREMEEGEHGRSKSQHPHMPSGGPRTISLTPQSIPTLDINKMTGSNNDAKNSVTGAATAVTSTVGNLVGGVVGTAGGVVGSAGRGLGDTITNTTGNTGKPLGDALNSLGNGVQDGTHSVQKGVENAGQGKKAW
ncbi:Hypothetical protein D9617_22g066830 [Elsinoe fawcettii]|nr:Hypothetical protein D9617_22g066830 [Elsinoe fawcettii]